MNTEHGMEEIMKAKAIVGMHDGFNCPGCMTAGPCFRKLKDYPVGKFIEDVKDLTFAAVREQQAGISGGCSSAYMAVASLPHTMMAHICEIEILRRVALEFCSRAVSLAKPDATFVEIVGEFNKVYGEFEKQEIEMCGEFRAKGMEKTWTTEVPEGSDPENYGAVEEKKPEWKELKAADGTK